MKYLKMLGLAAVAAMALTAFLGAGTASATVLCKTTPTLSGGHEACPALWDVTAATPIESTLAAGQTAKLTDAWGSVTCTKSTVSGTTSNTGSTTETVSGPIAVLTFTECHCAGGNNNAHVTALKKGSLEIHHITGTHNATLTGKGQEVTINCTPLGAECIYGTPAGGSHLGTVTGGNPATFAADATVTWFAGDDGTFGCSGFNDEATWQANYTVTTPKPLFSAEVTH